MEMNIFEVLSPSEGTRPSAALTLLSYTTEASWAWTWASSTLSRCVLISASLSKSVPRTVHSTHRTPSTATKASDGVAAEDLFSKSS